MKEELNTKIVEILTGMQNAVSKAGDFAMDQLPDIAMQYVMYGRIQSIVVLLLSLFCFVALVFSVYWLVKNPWEGDFGEKRAVTNSLGILICLIGAIYFSIIVFISISNALLVWLAPKVWLIKEIAVVVVVRLMLTEE